MENGLYLGVEGGRSGTRCVVITKEGEIVGRGRGERVDFVLAPGGRDRLRRTLLSTLEGTGLEEYKFQGAFLGLSGVVPGGELEQAVREVCADLFTAEVLEIDMDAVAAWAGALQLQPGIVLIAGSGSIALGVNEKRQRARAGGWGYLFGDEGGGFGIARDGLRRVLASQDAGEPEGSLAALYTRFFRRSPEELARDFYAGEVSRDALAAITAVIAKLAGEGDAAARELFQEAGRALALLVQAVGRRLRWPGKTITWSPVGGVFRAQGLILEPLKESLAEDPKKSFELVPPKFPPAVGAALLALERAEGGVDPRIFPPLAEQLTKLNL